MDRQRGRRLIRAREYTFTNPIMSVQVLPYSVEKYNKVPVLGTSAQDFQYRQGEAFVLSSLRLLLFEYKLSDTFGVVLLHRHFDLDKDEKLVDYNNQATSCRLQDDELVGGQVVPVSWRVMKTPGSPDVMPFEFEFRPLSKDKGIDLAIPQYQPFLKDLSPPSSLVATKTVSD
ncbi:hypothetical protein LTR64_002425 [Lithohypha guttulata]|uniref:uncharacterized protein n=1 Tax=Lithohypha guttulata TaxID=1690604 RepID=UPI002DE0B2AF|nr:hypothetical protein LTR51_001350 [Lithohypha guttulata]